MLLVSGRRRHVSSNVLADGAVAVVGGGEVVVVVVVVTEGIPKTPWHPGVGVTGTSGGTVGAGGRPSTVVSIELAIAV